MVRFIIDFKFLINIEESIFTFHYGQIYYAISSNFFKLSICIYIPLWLDLLLCLLKFLSICCEYLHSTMVRFIIYYKEQEKSLQEKFTFHYGQIYYNILKIRYGFLNRIYIPLWLDLLCSPCKVASSRKYLFTFHYGQIYYSCFIIAQARTYSIYIPLWLDLLYSLSDF